MRGSTWFFGLLLLAASIVGASWALNQSNSVDAKKNSDPPEIPDAITAHGFASGETGVVRIDPKQSGLVMEVVGEGTEVEKGAVLLRTDNRLYAIKVDEAKAALRQAEELLKQAESLPEKLKTKEEQIQNGISALAAQKREKQAGFNERLEKAKREGLKIAEYFRESLEEGIKAVEALIKVEESKQKEIRQTNVASEIGQAQANVDAKKAQLRLAEFARDECIVKAPAHGTILKVNVRVGELFAPNQYESAIEFLPKGPLVIKAEILQEWGSRVRKGQEVVIEDDTYAGPTWKGRVKSLALQYAPKKRRVFEPFQLNDARTLEAIIEILEGDANLRIDQRVRVNIKIDMDKKTPPKT